MALKIQATATKILALLPYRIHGSTMTSGRICGWNNQTKIKKKGNLHPLLKFIGWQIASYRSMLSATRTYVDEYVTRTLFFFFLISPKNQTKQKKQNKKNKNSRPAKWTIVFISTDNNGLSLLFLDCATNLSIESSPARSGWLCRRCFPRARRPWFSTQCPSKR